MVKRTAVLLALTLSGCAHYVPVHCVTPEQLKELREAEPPRIHDQLTGRADEDIKPIAGSNIRLRAWGGGLLNVLSGCVG